MIGALLFLLCGYLVIQFGRPLLLAAVFIGATTLLAIVGGDLSFGLLLSAAVTYAYTAFVYMMVEHFVDGVLIPIVVLVVGALILIAAAFVR